MPEDPRPQIHQPALAAEPGRSSPPAESIGFEQLLSQAIGRLQAGEPEAAQGLVERALALNPEHSEAWCLLGKIARDGGNLGDAVAAYEQAAMLDPGHVGCRTALGNLYRNMSMPEAAIHWHGEALALRPDELILNLNHLFVLPIVARSTQQIEQLRQRCLDGLWQLQNRQHSLAFGDYPMSHHPYYLIYHNCDDRVVLETYARLIRAQLPPLEVRSSAPRAPTARRRIGFLSGFFFAHSNSRAFEGLIRDLDRRRFEVVLIHLSSSHPDQVRDRLDASADEVLLLAGSLAEAVRQLQDLDLDLLFFTDIGMHPTSMLLACYRLAPVQVTGWGVPQTSGLTTVDHYISGTLVESELADQQYSEHLVRLPGLPCCYLAANLEQAIHGRDYFFLPEDVPLFGCLQSFWKLHPDFDGVLEQIAQRVPQAWFVFVEAEVTSYTQIFLERIASSAPTLAQRLILLRRMGRQEFISLAGCLDLLLDPPYFGSGVTLYETIHTGTPIVTLQGEFLRSRYVAGAYQLMGLEQAPVAQSLEGYIDWAVTLAQHPERLSSLRLEIAERARRSLYDRRDVVDAFADFVIAAIERVCPAQA